MSDLASKKCVPCRGGVPPLKGEKLKSYQEQVPHWSVVDEHHITQTLLFRDFRSALKRANQIGELAEIEGHHPDLCISWGKLEITIYTHKIDALTESDFILAAKIDALPEPA